MLELNTFNNFFYKKKVTFVKRELFQANILFPTQPSYFVCFVVISYILYRVIVDILPRLTGENDLALVETVTLLPATICLPGMRMMTLDNFIGNDDIHNPH